jgi:RNA polymerase sigma factor (sigma-70 family)
VARLTRTHEVVPELVEEALERVYVHVGRYDASRSAFRTWVYEQARYAVIEWAKRQNRERSEPKENVHDVESVDASAVDVEVGITPAERAALRRAMRKLKPTQRELLWWVEVLGLRPVELVRAGVVGDIPENQIKVYVWRARRALQALYETELRRSRDGE